MGVQAQSPEDEGQTLPFPITNQEGENAFETVELHLGIPNCVLIEFFAEGSPQELQIFIQTITNDRYSFNLTEIIELSGNGDFTLTVPMNTFKLKDPTYGTLSASNRFLGSFRDLTDLGVHAWNSKYGQERYSVRIDRLSLTSCNAFTANYSPSKSQPHDSKMRSPKNLRPQNYKGQQPTWYPR